MKVATTEYSSKGRRSNNEDSAFAGTLSTRTGQQVHVVAVADGVGGGERGEEASALVIDELCRFIERQTVGDAAALRTAFPAWAVETNSKVRALAETENSLVGTTLSAFLLCGGTSLVVHVGDSAVQVVSGGRCRLLTTPHNSGWGIDEDLMDGSLRRSLERCFGLRDIELDLVPNPIALNEPCRIVASSDGMHEKVPSATIAQFAQAEGSLDELARDLVTWSLAAGSKDNSTVALMQIGEPAARGRKPAFPAPRTAEAAAEATTHGLPRDRLLLVAAVLALLAVVLSVATYLHWRKGATGRRAVPLRSGAATPTPGTSGAGGAGSGTNAAGRDSAVQGVREQVDILLPGREE